MNTILNTIVSVDDSPLNLQLIESYFEDTNIRIISVNDSTKAEQVIIDKKPDLILLDVIMPEINGYELCEKIKSSPLLIDIPVIFMTAISGLENIIRGFKLGAVDYITKPFHFEELFARVTTHLELINSKNKLINELNLRKLTERKLKKSDTHFKLAQNAGKVGTWEWNIKNDKIIWSDMSYKIFDIEKTKDYLTYNEFINLVHPDDRQCLVNELEHSVKNNIVNHKTSYRITGKNNAIKWIEEISKIETDSNNSPIKMYGTLSDITEKQNAETLLKKQTEELLNAKETLEQNAENLRKQNERLFLSIKQAQENEVRFSTLFNKSNDSIIITSLDGVIIDVNNKTIEQLEYTKEDLIGNEVFFIKPEGFIEKRNILLKEVKGQNSIVFETINISKSGKHFPVEINSSIIFYFGKKAIFSTCRDITERKEAEKKILSTIIETEEKERQRIAQDLHDGLGPLMSTIKLYVQWLSKLGSKANKDELAKKAEETVEEAYKTLRSISNNLSPHILKNFGFVVALKSFIDKIKELSDIEINLTSNLNERFDPIRETIIYRILTEAINNTIRHAKAKTVNISITKENNKIYINYTDNGIGFDVDKVMESPKGMGIFNIKNRLKSIGGKINIKSEIGKGIQITLIIEIPKC